MRRFVLVGGSLLTIILAAPAAAQAGVEGPAFYVDGVTYRTVGTPTDLSRTGAPDSTYDTIYDLAGAQLNVAEAAPGDTDYNGGRWRVHRLEFPDGYEAAVESGDTNANGRLDSTAEIDLAFADGTAIDAGVIASFVCPVITTPRS